MPEKRSKIFLQFVKTVICIVFFEFIQKMSEMDLEKALCESIEEEQVANSDLLEGQSARQVEGDIFPTFNVAQFALADSCDFATI